MRIYIQTAPNTITVPFNYQHKLVGVLHKWLHNNDLHGNMALYSFSWLMNAKTTKNGLEYPSGAKFFISFYNEKYLKRIIKSILSDPEMCYGLSVTDINIQEDPDLKDRSSFRCAGPVFIRRFNNEKDIHYTFENREAGAFMKETLLHKMQLAGLERDDTLRIEFDISSPYKKTKLIDYRGIKNRVNQCPVIIEGKPETKAFAWNVGIGNSTGIGFGAIY
jgi:CRISPR-associated endoribonuclease Cas6